ncbi:MAG TPA: right-handed parallel beta-helix repeat-containing protein, partial [Candidatus Saccharimonadales bacterium]|nr:right-handed parallel beta-helix repeat-containing protein [Candidatus Saccharimonadales bacterium]
MNTSFSILRNGALAAALLLPSTLLSAPSFYVSPNGDDANSGAKDKPVRSLQRARDLVRTVNRNSSGDITVYLEAGVFRLVQPLELDARDSGPPGHNIIYTAAGTETPIITGAVPVTGWKLADAARNLWSAPAPPGLRNTRQLFIDGVRAHRASGRLPVKLGKTASGYTAEPAFPSWKNPSDVEFVYTGGNSLWTEHSEGLGAWTEPRCPVASIEGATITMVQPCWDNSTRRIMLPRSSGYTRTVNLVGPASIGKAPVSVENAYELLGTPGQWYFDRSTSTIYYVPRPGEDLATADVEAPVLEKLIVGQGAEGQPIHNIIFRNLEFTGATWLYPSGPQGFSEIQANYMVTGTNGWAVQGLCHLTPNGECPYGDWTKTPGNISFSRDQQIQFLRCAFVHLGGAGLELGDGSQSDLVEGCVFTDISANGLELGGVDRPDATGGDITRENRIVNNHIYDVAAEFHGGIGLCVGYAQRTVIQHNQLDHLPYSAISMGWGGWPDKIKQAGVSNFSENNRVADNLIFDHMLLLADGAAIYTQGLTGP